MMNSFLKKAIPTAVLGLGLTAFSFDYIQDKQPYPFEKGVYGTGEVLEFRLHYGFVTAGRAVIDIDPQYYKVGDKICYKINIFGRGTGTFDLFLRIRDTWRCYLDTAAYVPYKSFRNIEEGKYRMKEDVLYDYSTKKAKVSRESRDSKEELEYDIPTNVQDIVSGFYFLRRIDYSRLKIGDTIVIKAFFDKELYDFKVRYMGKDEIDTDAGEFKAIKLVPIMPKNKLFKGEESIKVWVSDDKNKIPLMCQAEMFVGSVKLELTKFKNLKHKPNIID